MSSVGRTQEALDASSFQKSWNTVWHVNGNWMQIISGYIQLKQKKDSMSKVIWKNVVCFSIWCQQHIQESCSYGHTSRSRYSFLVPVLFSQTILKSAVAQRRQHRLSCLYNCFVVVWLWGFLDTFWGLTCNFQVFLSPWNDFHYRIVSFFKCSTALNHKDRWFSALSHLMIICLFFEILCWETSLFLHLLG